jgi:formate hydrogenlyase subunit 4
MEWFIYILQFAMVPALSPLMLGIIRKVKARLQSRVGASIFQPYRDLLKLFCKDEVISEDASWVFTLAPYCIFGTTLALAAGIPVIAATSLIPMDILVFAYTLALGVFILALAGIDTGGAFGGFGSSREMMIAALTEGGLVLSLFAASLIAGTTNLAMMSAMLPGVSGIALLPLALAGAAFAISLLAENARYPVDNPATHLELTMVHEAMILEYSGKRLALIEWAASNKLLLFSAILVNIFSPFGIATSLSISAILPALGIFLVKILGVAVGIAFVESSMAKFRIFRVPDLLFTSFAISVVAIVITVI